ncbi:HyaD/HybD family hydrogenase maturation endopeptidase [Ferrimonas marina]|uniref:Hydrogenase maturation protease n=1 Tax=Ferrimonas marina TaxID=299255 RepID=A0A1M5VG61_9GAMM|nr:HyaD/HybD family hydrogenase maturation endopeptidase [Ferrimonas marina]SHH74191.1 hydrogenase maturation protease [Ferrimonas marina]
MPKKILILGIGNVLYADEGIGVHFAHYFQQKYRIEGPVEVTFVDGGTLAHALIPMMTQYDQVIVVDTIHSTQGQHGDVYFFDFDAAPHHIDFQGSAHEVEMLHTLTMMDMVGDRPQTLILGVIPEVLESMSFELTDKVRAAVPLMERALAQHLSSLGLICQQQADPDIAQLAAVSCAGEKHEAAV